MRVVTVYCSRCKTRIESGVSVLTVQIPAGYLCGKLTEPIDVCRKCADSFMGWLNESPGETPEAPEGG